MCRGSTRGSSAPSVGHRRLEGPRDPGSAGAAWGRGAACAPADPTCFNFFVWLLKDAACRPSVIDHALTVPFSSGGDRGQHRSVRQPCGESGPRRRLVLTSDVVQDPRPSSRNKRLPGGSISTKAQGVQENPPSGTVSVSSSAVTSSSRCPQPGREWAGDPLQSPASSTRGSLTAGKFERWLPYQPKRARWGSARRERARSLTGWGPPWRGRTVKGRTQ